MTAPRNLPARPMQPSVRGSGGLDARRAAARCVLTPGALAFVARSRAHVRAAASRSCSSGGASVQARLDAGERRDFLAETRAVRDGATGQVAPLPADLRRPARRDHRPGRPQDDHQRAQLGANVFMADFEDANSPTWENLHRGPDQPARRGARGRSRYDEPASGKALRAQRADRDADGAAARLAPAREARRWSTASRCPASLFDFGLYFFHNAKALLARGTGPYFYLPKLESHLEARLWNDVFVCAQEALGLPRGTIRATVLIETMPAAFEMDEILYELREHSAGLNCGRWDYIFSFIKKFRNDPTFVLPDRAQVTMDQHFLRAYTQLLDPDLPPPRRPRDGRHGGADPDQERPGGQRGGAREGARRQAARGHATATTAPGSPTRAWCRSRRRSSTRTCRARTRSTRKRDDVHVTAADLLTRARGHAITEAGLRHNIDVGMQYLEAWLRGHGLRAALQPDGGRRHRRDLARPGLAVDPPRRALDDGRQVTARAVRAAARRGAGRGCAASSARRASTAAASTTAARPVRATSSTDADVRGVPDARPPTSTCSTDASDGRRSDLHRADAETAMRPHSTTRTAKRRTTTGAGSGIARPYTRRGRGAAARHRCSIEHTLARLGAERLWELLHDRAVRRTRWAR